MKIDNVTVHYTLTESLPGYCNVKPGLTLSAVIEDGDDPEEVRERLTEEAKAYVRGLVDEALEKYGKAPRYLADSERFRVMRTLDYAFVLIVPDGWDAGECPEELWRELIIQRPGHSLAFCRNFAREIVNPLHGLVVESLDGEIPPAIWERMKRWRQQRIEQESEEVEYLDENDWDEDEDEDEWD